MMHLARLGNRQYTARVKCDDCRHGEMDFENTEIQCAFWHPVIFQMPEKPGDDWGWRPKAKHCRDYSITPMQATSTEAGTTYGPVPKNKKRAQTH